MNATENTYAVKCALEGTLLGYVRMTAALAATLDRREHDDATWDIMFERVESQVHDSEWVSPISDESGFDGWMAAGFSVR